MSHICFLYTGNTGLVHLLLPHADPDIADKKGQTPLMLAIKEGFVKVVDTLLETGERVDVGKQDKDGNTALHYACKSGYVDIVNLLLNKSAAINVRNHAGDTPLVVAAEEEQFLCVIAIMHTVIHTDNLKAAWTHYVQHQHQMALDTLPAQLTAENIDIIPHHVIKELILLNQESL